MLDTLEIPRLTREEALANRMRPLTVPICEQDGWIVRNVSADLRRGRIEHALVTVDDGRVEVWRDIAGWVYEP